MIEKFKDLLRKKAKEGKFVDDKSKKIKESMLDDIDSIMNEAGGEELKGMKKVTVAAPDKDGLEEGLEKAKEIVGSEEEMEECKEDEAECDGMEEGKDNKLAKLKKLMELASQLKE
ncbi:MAG TPA: hypothetical protein VI911_08815 [Patescibacteria group bacterium]|nr:MAG: hypothetical protein UR43_C0005G0069 [candidate division TM6 bacterium GW2011_GWF2_33_332]HLD91098.1 hypothetical protein [Patescibacteria group bacterium]